MPGVVSKHFFQGGTLILIERACFTASAPILVEITAQIWFHLESEHVLTILGVLFIKRELQYLWGPNLSFNLSQIRF